MIHEGDRLDKEIERLKRQLERPVGIEKRVEMQAAILRLQAKKRAWERPH